MFSRLVTRSNFLTMNKRFMSEVRKKKDYYAILNIAPNSSDDEIKKAYRNLAKKYHPDVNTTGSDLYEPNIQKFRDIAEAYAVLSNKALRLDFDMRNKNYPEQVYNSEKMKKMQETQVERDASGNYPKPGPIKGSYGDFRLQKIAEWRKKFNVDEHGFYKGGVPRKGKGYIRGASMGITGQMHSTHSHNFLAHDNPSANPLDSFGAQQHKMFMNTSRTNYQRFRPYFYMDEVSQDSQYDVSDENRWLVRLPFILIALYFGIKFLVSNHKNENFEQVDFIKKLQPQEYQVQGMLLLQADETKFTQKYLNREEYHAWLENDIRKF